MSELFNAGPWRAVDITAPRDVDELQRFFEANPDYFEIVEGAPAAPGTAHEAFTYGMPEGWAFTRRSLLAFRDAGGAMRGMADYTVDLFAPGIWHIALFMVSGALHGTGAARTLYDALERWMAGQGARWLRLGVIAGNTRAERFWQACGYEEVRRREDIEMGGKVHTLRVMVKRLTAAPLDEYLALVARDRPEG